MKISKDTFTLCSSNQDMYKMSSILLYQNVKSLFLSAFPVYVLFS